MALDGSIRSVREQIRDHLWEEILSGRLVEGERLHEAQLAERFGVSRSPIREVLAQLTYEGLLESKPNCGVTVSPSESSCVLELIVPIRRLLETFALKHFFHEIQERDFLAWESILHHLKSACERKDVAAIIQHDLAFHRFILTRAGVPALLTIWKTIVAPIRRHFQHVTSHSCEDYLKVYEDHRQLVDVFRCGDAEAAVKALGKHIW